MGKQGDLENSELHSKSKGFKSLNAVPSKPPVVNNTQQVRASNSVRWSECRRKIICWTTPVIRAIIVWAVSSVKLLNNVVVGIGKTMKSSKTAPSWAVDLVVQVCSDYKRALPRQFQWYQSRDKQIREYTIKANKHSSGHASKPKPETAVELETA